MNKLIYDPTGDSDRYKSTIYMDYIVTNEKELTKGTYYSYETISCTSAVKSTAQNWFYILPYGIDRKEFQKWLDEFVGFFPTLKIELLDDDAFEKLTIKPRTDCKNGSTIGSNHYDKETNELISLKCTKDCYVNHFNFLLDTYITFLKEKKVTEEFTTYVHDFMDTKFKEFEEKCRTGGYNVNISKNSFTLGYRSSYNRETVNLKNIDKDKIEEYLIKLVENNIVYIKSSLNLFPAKERLILKVLHSKKSYVVESYLAHHMIRIGLSPDLNPFMRQYFTINEKLPNIFFWNKILLAQMGFKFYSYWWLTDARFFKMVTKEEYEKLAHGFNSYSANGFLHLFEHTYSKKQQEELINLYKTETIEELYHKMYDHVVIVLKPEKRERFMNLRLQNEYCVHTTEGDYYFVKGDDYTVRRYKKNNFNIKS